MSIYPMGTGQLEPHLCRSRSNNVAILILDKYFQIYITRFGIDGRDGATGSKGFTKIRGATIGIIETRKGSAISNPIDHDLIQPIPLQGPIDYYTGVIFNISRVGFIIMYAVGIPDRGIV